jgi:putative ABC transport system ATP-binding protein
METVISFNNINKIYHIGKIEVPALRSITLDVHRGEFIGIMGPSGSGKSTLLHIMGCLDRPTSGTYLFCNEDVYGLPDRKLAQIRNSRIGFVFQSFNLLWNENAIQNVMLPLIYSKTNSKWKRAVEALEAVELAHRLRHKPSEMSGGEQQRVAIARAMVKEPDIILADEPTGNLDSTTGSHIMQIFKQLNDKGVTIVIITHAKEVTEACDRVIHLRDGRIETLV